ncbi:MAG: DUF948 domain-containing protein [Aeriscardovia sp.]|nr:DUF948 domain-containing protein [Aeriscardovia sp.]
MSIGAIAGLIAAIVFAILAGVMIYPLIRLGKLFDTIADTVRDAGGHAIPAIDGGVTTVEQINRTLADVNDISHSVQYTAKNASALGDLYMSVLGKPVIKIASSVWAFRKTASSFLGRNKGESPVATSKHAKNSSRAAATKE